MTAVYKFTYDGHYLLGTILVIADNGTRALEIASEEVKASLCNPETLELTHMHPFNWEAVVHNFNGDY